MQSTERFSGRADNYAKFRPTYPPECIEWLRGRFNITDSSVIADIGSGTGILSALLLQLNCTVIGVEPNDSMRSIGEQRINNEKFISVKGSGETTNLRDHSVDVITVAQAFHWLDEKKAKTEFKRILKPGGDIALLWNIQVIKTAFGGKYEAIKEKFGKDYTRIRKSHEPDLERFFRPKTHEVIKFPHHVILDQEGLHGLIQSSSFMPVPADVNFHDMEEELDKLFREHNENGLVRIDYETHVHYGAA